MTFSGVVLAGGRSSRFGSNKARFVYQGKPLLQHVLDSLEPAAERFIIAADTYPEVTAPSYPDMLVAAGPLGGIYTALHYAQHDWVAVAACDMPRLSPEYWQRLAGYRGAAPVVIVKSKNGLEPLAAFYHRSLEPVIADYLATGMRAVHGFINTVESQTVALESLEVSAAVLANANYPADLLEH